MHSDLSFVKEVCHKHCIVISFFADLLVLLSSMSPIAAYTHIPDTVFEQP